MEHDKRLVVLMFDKSVLQNVQNIYVAYCTAEAIIGIGFYGLEKEDCEWGKSTQDVVMSFKFPLPTHTLKYRHTLTDIHSN